VTEMFLVIVTATLPDPNHYYRHRSMMVDWGCYRDRKAACDAALEKYPAMAQPLARYLEGNRCRFEEAIPKSDEVLEIVPAEVGEGLAVG
jgi:predicted Mrr-cat superfamily restriction endonuclease